MCANRTWNKLHSEEIRTTEDGKVLLSFIGERSDYEIFKVIINVRAADYTSIAEKIKKGFEVLESYRNCDCTAKGGKCIRHIEKIEVEDLEKNQQAKKPNFSFGGEQR